jgi:hypothetical protein
MLLLPPLLLLLVLLLLLPPLLLLLVLVLLLQFNNPFHIWQLSCFEMLLPLPPPPLLLLLLQFNNPFHLWRLWDPEVRLQRRCLARHDALVGQKVRQLRKRPPAPHTIGGRCSCTVADWSGSSPPPLWLETGSDTSSDWLATH